MVGQAAYAWKSNNNIELYACLPSGCQSGNPPNYSVLFQFQTSINVWDSSYNCHCFSLQENVFDSYHNIPAQGVIVVGSSGVTAYVEMPSGGGAHGTGCPNNNNNGYNCVIAPTGVSPSTVLAGGWPKVALDYSNVQTISGAYFAIWNSAGNLVYLQSFGPFTVTNGNNLVYGEAVIVGQGFGSNAQFTSTSGLFTYATDYGPINSANLPNLGYTQETSNMCYGGSPSGIGTYVVTQTFSTSGC